MHVSVVLEDDSLGATLTLFPTPPSTTALVGSARVGWVALGDLVLHLPTVPTPTSSSQTTPLPPPDFVLTSSDDVYTGELLPILSMYGSSDPERSLCLVGPLTTLLGPPSVLVLTHERGTLNLEARIYPHNRFSSFSKRKAQSLWTEWTDESATASATQRAAKRHRCLPLRSSDASPRSPTTATTALESNQEEPEPTEPHTEVEPESGLSQATAAVSEPMSGPESEGPPGVSQPTSPITSGDSFETILLPLMSSGQESDDATTAALKGQKKAQIVHDDHHSGGDEVCSVCDLDLSGGPCKGYRVCDVTWTSDGDVDESLIFLLAPYRLGESNVESITLTSSDFFSLASHNEVENIVIDSFLFLLFSSTVNGLPSGV